MKKEPKSYEKAMEELQSIVEELQSEVVQVDSLSAKTKRAGELIQWCRERLRKAESEINREGEG